MADGAPRTVNSLDVRTWWSIDANCWYSFHWCLFASPPRTQDDERIIIKAYSMGPYMQVVNIDIDICFAIKRWCQAMSYISDDPCMRYWPEWNVESLDAGNVCLNVTMKTDFATELMVICDIRAEISISTGNSTDNCHHGVVKSLKYVL